MSQGGGPPRQPRRLHQDHKNDRTYRNHPDYESPPSKYFDDAYEITSPRASRTPTPFSSHRPTTPKPQPTGYLSTALQTSNAPTTPRTPPTGHLPTAPQTSNAPTAGGSLAPRAVQCSSEVRPGPYDPATAPRYGDPFSREENYRIGWAMVDGRAIEDLYRVLPNRTSSSVQTQWSKTLCGLAEFAWVMPRRKENINAKKQKKYEERDAKLRGERAEKTRLREEKKENINAEKEKKYKERDAKLRGERAEKTRLREENSKRKREEKEKGESDRAKRGGRGRKE